MTARLIHLIRRYSRQAPRRAGRAACLTVITVLMVMLTACRLMPATQTSEPSYTTTAASQVQSSGETTASAGTSATSGSATESSGTTSCTVPAVSPTGTATTDTQATTTARPTCVKPSPTAGPTSGHTTARPTPVPTARPTAKPTARPTSTPVPAAASFPYRNYGTFFRDNYGTNQELVKSSDGGILLDVGCSPYGVALIRVDSIPADKRCKVIAAANGKSYQYDILTRSKYMGIPLQMGSGSYTVTVYEQVSGTSYTPKLTHTFTVSLASGLKPYTAASLMCDFSRGSSCVQKANNLCSGKTTAPAKVEAVYNWIVNNIDYDRALAESISSGQVTTYIPSPDKTYSSRKGICFDYACLMTAMLRSQGIPTRLAVGQTPLGYHAWNEVYFAGKGWVIVASFKWKYIDGSGWVMFDTTFAAGGMTPSSIQDTTHTKQKTY